MAPIRWARSRLSNTAHLWHVGSQGAGDAELHICPQRIPALIEWLSLYKFCDKRAREMWIPRLRNRDVQAWPCISCVCVFQWFEDLWNKWRSESKYRARRIKHVKCISGVEWRQMGIVGQALRRLRQYVDSIIINVLFIFGLGTRNQECNENLGQYHDRGKLTSWLILGGTGSANIWARVSNSLLPNTSSKPDRGALVGRGDGKSWSTEKAISSWVYSEFAPLTDIWFKCLNSCASQRAHRDIFEPRIKGNCGWKALKRYILNRIRRNEIHHSPNQAGSCRVVRIVSVYYISECSPFPPSVSLTRGLERKKSKVEIGKERHRFVIDFHQNQFEHAPIGRPSKRAIVLQIASFELVITE